MKFYKKLKYIDETNSNSCFSGSSNLYGLAEMFPFTSIFPLYADDSKVYLFIQVCPLGSWLITNILNNKMFKLSYWFFASFKLFLDPTNFFFYVSKLYHKSYFPHFIILEESWFVPFPFFITFNLFPILLYFVSIHPESRLFYPFLLLHLIKSFFLAQTAVSTCLISASASASWNTFFTQWWKSSFIKPCASSQNNSELFL